VCVCVWKWSYNACKILDLVLQGLKDSDSTSAITTKLWVLLLGNSGWSTKLVVGSSEQNSPSVCGLLKVKVKLGFGEN
jgi:hypothetical protein